MKRLATSRADPLLPSEAAQRWAGGSEFSPVTDAHRRKMRMRYTHRQVEMKLWSVSVARRRYASNRTSNRQDHAYDGHDP
jgi:hypothetical protein